MNRLVILNKKMKFNKNVEEPEKNIILLVKIKSQLVQMKKRLNLIESYFTYRQSFVNKLQKIIYNREIQNY